MMPGKPLFSLALGAVLSLLLVCLPASRADADPLDDLPGSAEDTTPLATGDRAPAFTVQTVSGETREFDPANLSGPTVLISFRGGWCPYCNLHLSELRGVVPELRERGFDVLFLSGDAPDQLYASLKKETQDDIEGLDYTILSDANIEAARAFGTAFRTGSGLADYLDGKGVAYEEGSVGRHGALSVPYVYVVDSDGRIVFDFVEPDYKVRLPADELLAAAEAAL
jgi:peroxiredoxin